MSTVLSDGAVLSDKMLDIFAERAPSYDRENRFFTEDFEDLRLAGYLELVVPAELGGRGLGLAQVCREQRRLAYRAPATALATNMHLYWTGVAADLLRMGDSSCRWILEEAADGEVFAAGLYRDVRCGGFHPANSALVHELVGKTTLGILGEEPRW